jgi:hypothetical protein
MFRQAPTALAAVLVLVGTAWAFQIKLPARATLKATVVANEAGMVLFDTVPGKVEVTNLPSAAAGGAVFTAYGTTSCPTGFALLYAGGIYQQESICFGSPHLPLADGLCWQTPPNVGTGCPYAYQVGNCVVCRATS